MKQSWEIKKLGEVCEIINGFAFKSQLFKDCGDDILRISNIQNGVIDDRDIAHFSKDDYPKVDFDKYTVFPNDIVVALSGATTGKFGINNTDRKLYLNQRVAICREKTNDINHRFLLHFLKIQSKSFLESAAGVAQPNLSTEQIKLYEIPIPPLSEQEKIVAELDCLSGIIEKKKQQLKELDALAQSIFYEMFGNECNDWDKEKLINIYKFIDYRGKTPNKITDGIPLITAKNIRKGYIDYSVREYISEEEFSQRQSRGIAQKGDLLFTTEAPMGYVAIANLDVFSTGQRLITFQKKQTFEVDNIYVLYYLLSHTFQLELNNQATGATVKGIKGSKLEQMTIPLPPLSLQQSFAQKIESIEKQKELIKQSIAETETLFNSRMEFYFN